MGVRLLGALEMVDGDGDPIEIGGPQPRVILAMLVAAGGKVVGDDALIDAIWGESPPLSASGTLQTYVSRLRRALEEVEGSIVRAPAGYRLDIDRHAIDVHQFEALADEGRSLLEAGDPTTARSVLVEAEQLWRGPALLEVRDRPRIAGIARRLDDRRLTALEDRLAADIALGHHRTAVAELAQLVGEHPLREGLWELLALARYRSGMQAEALRAINQARETLAESLGVEPGAGLRNLEQAILAHDPALAPTALERASGTPAASAHPAPSQVAPATPDRPALIGRDRELSSLTLALEEAASGRTCIVVVQGEAGVGKTRLVEEMAAHAAGRGACVVWGRALEGDAAPAFWPWLAVLRTLRQVRPDRSTDAVDQLLDAAGASAATPAIGARSQLLDGVLQLLEPAAAPPLVVIIEDVQWADAESLELLIQVASGPIADGVMLTLTLREGEDARREAVGALVAATSRRAGTKRLHITGLQPAATAALLSQVSGHPVEAALARVVHERAEGNPFYAIELQRLLDSEGLVDATSVAKVAVPAGVRDVIRQRLTQLPQSTLELLRLAAIAGRDIDVELVSAASDRSIDACLDALDVALAHRLLVDAGQRAGLRFSHALVREVIVDELSSLRRARLHLAVADALMSAGRGEEEAEVLAEHLWAAVPIGVSTRAADALDRAAEVAIRRFALAAACDLLERSLDLRRSGRPDSESAAAELETLVKLVWALRARGGDSGARHHYARGAELARQLQRPDVELQLQWNEWSGACAACDFDGARPIADRFREWAATSDDPLVQFAGLTAWAIQRWYDGDIGAAHDAIAQVAEVRSSVACGVGDLSLAAELVVLSTGFGLCIDEQVGRLAHPEAAYAAAAAAVDGELSAAIIWTAACTNAAAAGDLERLERCSRRVLEAAGDETLGVWGTQARMYLGAALTATGRPEEGRELFDAGRRTYAASGMRTGLGLVYAVQASAEIAAGDIERARQHITTAQQELSTGERWQTPFILLAAADVAEASGASPADVLSMRSEAEAVASSQGAVLAAARARAAIARHENSDAREGPLSLAR